MRISCKLFFAFLLLSLPVLGQPPLTERKPESGENNFGNRIFFGGYFGLQFGTQTLIEIAPSIGYKVTNRFSAGMNLKYSYYHYTDVYNNVHNSNVYGGGPFARFFITEGLFLHGEGEILNIEVPDAYTGIYSRENITSIFLGGGYRQMMGERSSLDMLLLFNVNDNRNSPYQNPVIRIGFGFGI
jgi:hypothetical protein